MQLALDLVYGAPRRYTGDLRLSADGSTLSGEVRDTSESTKESLALTCGR